MDKNGLLILGGGWVGLRIARLSKRKVVVTTRDLEKLESLKKLGFTAIQFDLLDESTWVNLPAESPVLITFALEDTHIEIYKKFWPMHMKNRQVFCIGTTSVYGFHTETNLEIKEDNPLTGKSIFSSYEVRINGENWALEHGASVLNLPGMCGDEETLEGDELETLEESRSIRA